MPGLLKISARRRSGRPARIDRGHPEGDPEELQAEFEHGRFLAFTPDGTASTLKRIRMRGRSSGEAGDGARPGRYPESGMDLYASSN